MRHVVPIFHSSVHTPVPTKQPGLTLAHLGGRRGRSCWLHGSLTVSLDDARGRSWSWLRALSVTAITEIDQVPQIAALCRTAALHDPPSWQPLADGRHARLPFSFDLGRAFRFALPDEPVNVHVSAWALCSTIVRVGQEAAPIAAPALDDAIAQLIEAYQVAEQTPAAALEHFARAFELAPALAHEVDGCHLYNLACIHARLGRSEQALARLREDARRRTRRHTRAVVASLTGDTGKRDDLEAELRMHFEALREDVDLAELGDARDPRALLDAEED